MHFVDPWGLSAVDDTGNQYSSLSLLRDGLDDEITGAPGYNEQCIRMGVDARNARNRVETGLEVGMTAADLSMPGPGTTEARIANKIANSKKGRNFLQRCWDLIRGKKPSNVQKHIIPDEHAKHIFRNADGHLPDSTANRKLIQDVADDPSTTLGIDKWGSTWSARTLEDGTQVWTQTRNGQIRNAGLKVLPP